MKFGCNNMPRQLSCKAYHGEAVMAAAGGANVPCSSTSTLMWLDLYQVLIVGLT